MGSGRSARRALEAHAIDDTCERRPDPGKKGCGGGLKEVAECVRVASSDEASEEAVEHARVGGACGAALDGPKLSPEQHGQLTERTGRLDMLAVVERHDGHRVEEPGPSVNGREVPAKLMSGLDEQLAHGRQIAFLLGHEGTEKVGVGPRRVRTSEVAVDELGRPRRLALVEVSLRAAEVAEVGGAAFLLGPGEGLVGVAMATP